VRFDTDLMSGVGHEVRGLKNYFSAPNADISVNGTRLNFKDVYSLHYAQARGNFSNAVNNDSYRDFIRRASEAQKERDALAVILVFSNWGEDICAKAAHALAAAGVSVIEKGKGGISYYIIADASAIDWFAYDL
jgi:hypothetical protein